MLKNEDIQIFHIIENMDDKYGGPAKSVPYLVKYLNKNHIRNIIFSVNIQDNEYNSVCKENNINLHTVKSKIGKKIYFNKEFCSNIRNFIDSNNTILHVHNLWTYPTYCAYSLSRTQSLPLIISVRNQLHQWNLEKSKIKKSLALFLFQRKMLESAQCLHATDIEEVHAIRAFGIDIPIALIPNGIELSEFNHLPKKDLAIKHLNLNADAKYMLFMSRIHPKKGLEYLIHAFGKQARKFQNWKLLIAGPIYDKRYYENILFLIKKYGISDQVVFLGMLRGENRLHAYASSDLFILPSHSENFGIAIGEAMAAKLPVITTQGTPWKILNEKKAGWWIELEQKKLNDTLYHALSLTDEERSKMGSNGYTIIKDNYNWAQIANQMTEVYKWILGENSKPVCIH